MMITVLHFRLLLIASLILGLIGGGIDFVYPGLLPQVFQQAQKTHDATISITHMQLLLIMTIAVILTTAASYYGLYRFRPWAPRLSLISSVLGLFLALFFGAYAQSGLASATSYLSCYMWGAVLALAYSTPFSTQFQRCDG
jgi:hypothetical protein